MKWSKIRDIIEDEVTQLMKKLEGRVAQSILESLIGIMEKRNGDQNITFVRGALQKGRLRDVYVNDEGRCSARSIRGWDFKGNH